MSCSEWKEYRLEEACNISTGFAFKSKEYLDNGKYKVVRGDNVKTGFIYWEEKSRYWNDLTDRLSKYILQEKDIVIGMDGSRVGKNRAIISENDLPAILAQRVACVRAKADFSQDYIRYVIMSKTFEYYVDSIKTGTSIPHISMKQIGEFKFKAPSLEIQEKIADVLSSLDDKIELNNEVNKTLEEMAQSIFKRWFVDFEIPNEDGEPYKSSGGEMVDSELGMIPKGWEVKKISELIEVKDGTHASPKVSKEGFPLVTSKHIKGDRIAIEDAKIISEKDYLEVNKRSKVDTGDILISMIGTVGLTYFVQEEEINFAIKNIGLFKTSQNKTLSEYFYLYLKSDNMKNYIEARLAGTTQKYISLGELRNIPVVLPNDSIIDKFKKVVGVLLDKRRLNIINNEELMITRDTLLPKLMNGEIMI